MNEIHVVIDWETLGSNVAARPALLSLGFVIFSWNNITGEAKVLDRVEMSIKQSYNDKAKRTRLTSTLEWWNEQSELVREVAFSENFTMTRVLNNLKFKLKQHTDDLTSVYLWGNGSEFDVTLLDQATRDVGFIPWWDFRKVNSLRTVKYFMPDVGLGVHEDHVAGLRLTPHVASHDATKEAYYIIAAMEWKYEAIKTLDRMNDTTS